MPRLCCTTCVLLFLAILSIQGCGNQGQGQSDGSCEPPSSIRIDSGELEAAFRGNSNCQTPTDNLSGISLLVHDNRPEVEAFQSVGLNFEHIIAGHFDSFNMFEPRFGELTASRTGNDSVTLTRKVEDSLWGIATNLTYTLVPPYYIDFEFTATPSDVETFQPQNYITFFFASYMAGVDTPEGYYFRGIPGQGEPEQWVNTSSTADFSGATFIAEEASSLHHDDDPVLDLNLDNKNFPRIVQPYYCGRVLGGMVYEIMFDKLYDAALGEEVRFSNFKLQPANPAWDFEYIVHNPQENVPHQLRGRLVWKPFVDLEDCKAEYDIWIGS